MNVRVDHPRQREKASCVDLALRVRSAGLDERGNPSVADEDVSGPGAIGDDHAAAYRELGLVAHSSVMAKSCAPSQRVIRPTSRSCSLPSNTVAK